jgi:hypothetical protein
MGVLPLVDKSVVECGGILCEFEILRCKNLTVPQFMRNFEIMRIRKIKILHRPAFKIKGHIERPNKAPVASTIYSVPSEYDNTSPFFQIKFYFNKHNSH